MGCGGSKSTSVANSNERAPLLKDGAESTSKPEVDKTDENTSPEDSGEKTTSGYSKLPQEDNGEAAGNEDDTPATTRYTKLPPTAEDKAPVQDETESAKPEKILEEDDEAATNEE